MDVKTSNIISEAIKAEQRRLVEALASPLDFEGLGPVTSADGRLMHTDYSRKAVIDARLKQIERIKELDEALTSHLFPNGIGS